ncbi:unnamed protein product [Rhizophagus irregularis]|nr:unnamed protein product [Rhizophagus irregularis]
MGSNSIFISGTEKIRSIFKFKISTLNSYRTFTIYLQALSGALQTNIDKNKELSSEICSVMYIVSNLNTQNEVLKILHKIRNCDESGTTGISSVFSKMDHVIWSQTPNNINARESAYANVNHDGCNLFLFAGIVR